MGDRYAVAFAAIVVGGIVLITAFAFWAEAKKYDALALCAQAQSVADCRELIQ